MAKIYLARHGSNYIILEVELIKKTAEQIHIDNRENSIRVVWSDRPNAYVPWLSHRLQKYRENYFDSVAAAMEFLAEKMRSDLEKTSQRVRLLETQLAELNLLLEREKKKEKVDVK